MREIILAFGLVVLVASRTSAAEPGNVVALFEDDAEALLKVLNNPTGDPGQGLPEKQVVFSGAASIKIIPLQRFSPDIKGWKFRVVEKPKPGEYRFLRFAWKADGCAGIMLQLHDDKDWNIRYTAGENSAGWGTKFVSDSAPANWTVVTIDLYRDFGERTLHGIALTVFGFGGHVGYFDHIYLGRSIADLDRIDATGLRRNGKPLELTERRMEQCWAELTSDRGEIAYRAFWMLANAGRPAAQFLNAKLPNGEAKIDATQIEKWILQLNNNRFAVREAASRELSKNFDAAAEMLRSELKRNPPPETRKRIVQLLSQQANSLEKTRIQKARRILEEIDRLAKSDSRPQ